MRWVSVSRAALHRAGLRRVALPAAGWPGGARRGASGGGGDDNPYFPAGMPQELKDSIMLWYDLERQKATNESMALSPILKDLSGNGNDATCYNFGWSGMSGIGGYNSQYVINNKYVMNFTADSEYKGTINKINSDGPITYSLSMGKITKEIPECKVKVSGLTDDVVIKYRYVAEQGSDTLRAFDITEDGIYTLPRQYVPTLNGTNDRYWIGLGFLQGTYPNSSNITIEFLPFYPNALVSDGVDDYAFVQDKYDDEGNLINKKSLVLNKEDGYTVIAKRKWLKETLTCGFISKIDKANNTKGAFGFELSDTLIAKVISNWGKNNPITLEKNDITYGTTTKYNSFKINIGNRQTDTDYISIFNFAKDTKFYGQLALYSLILFNRDLTDEEIEWVKKNMIESGED